MTTEVFFPNFRNLFQENHVLAYNTQLHIEIQAHNISITGIYRGGQKEVYSCEYAKTQSLFLYYYLLITVLFSI